MKATIFAAAIAIAMSGTAAFAMDMKCGGGLRETDIMAVMDTMATDQGRQD